jgi:hypothetical protein
MSESRCRVHSDSRSLQAAITQCHGFPKAMRSESQWRERERECVCVCVQKGTERESHHGSLSDKSPCGVVCDHEKFCNVSPTKI